MQLNSLKPGAGAKRKRNRVGRGEASGNGKTCGRGVKGQKSRSGGLPKPGFEGGQMPLQRRLPKRGFRSQIALGTAEVRLDTLDKLSVDVIDLPALRAARVVNSAVHTVKVIGSGELSRAITVRGLKATKGAVKAIEAAGGSVEAAEGN